MKDNKLDQESNLVWIDLEMTGLNPTRDLILEIATIVTDNNLNILGHGPALVINHSEEQLALMNDFVKDLHTKSGLLQAVEVSTISTSQAEEQTLAFIKTLCKSGTAVLSGNSIWQDRAFLAQHMPSIIAFLHYRLLDVSTVKELVRRWYPDANNAQFKKRDTHRALGDIEESINELRWYKERFFVHE